MRDHPVRVVMRAIMGRVLGLYFRDIEVVGAVPPRHLAGRLLAANHVNAIVDPLLVLTTTRALVSPVAKSTLWKVPGLRWLLDVGAAVPIIRRQDAPGKSANANAEVFARIASHLGAGGNLLIFPEGTSHNQPHLSAMRSGAGQMLAAAHQAGARGLTLQAVALEFDARDVFRSRALVVYGPVRAVDDLLGTGPDQLAERVTATISADLRDLVIEADTWDDRVTIARVAALYANDRDESSLEATHALGLRARHAQDVLAAIAPATLATLRADVTAYADALAAVAVDDAVVKRGRITDAPRRIVRALTMVATAPLALAGLVLYALPYPVPRMITRKLRTDADAVSTYKLGAAMVVYPVWLTLGIITACVLLPGRWPWAAIALLIAAPLATLPWIDAQERLTAKLRALVPGSSAHAALPRLRTQRAALLAALEAARAQVEPGA